MNICGVGIFQNLMLVSVTIKLVMMHSQWGPNNNYKFADENPHNTLSQVFALKPVNVLFHLCRDKVLYGGCTSGRAVIPVIRRSMVRSQYPVVHMSKCIWARYWTPTCSRCLVSSVWMLSLLMSRWHLSMFLTPVCEWVKADIFKMTRKVFRKYSKFPI